MTQKSRETIAFVALGLAIVFGAYNLWPDNTDQLPEEVSVIDTAVGRPPAIPTPNTSGLIDIEQMGTLAWGGDPFHTERATRRVIRRESRPIWHLSGILFNAANPMAIINKKTVGIGDIVDKAEVVRIEPKMVVLRFKGVELSLTVTKG